jgi:hypothetical protein
LVVFEILEVTVNLEEDALAIGGFHSPEGFLFSKI